MDVNKIVEMNLAYRQLRDLVDKTLSGFENFSIQATGKENKTNTVIAEVYSSVLSIYNKTDNRIEFGLFDERFLLEAVIYPNANKCAVLTTYRIILNHKNYPNKELILIPNMPIMLTMEGQLLFIKDGNCIENFNTTYINTLFALGQNNKIQ